MAEVLDILMPYKAAASPDIGCYKFTVNTTGPKYVGLTDMSGTGTLYNANGKSKFAIGDSFTLLSFGLIMPLSFQLDRSVNVTYFPFIQMYLAGNGQTSGHVYYFQELTSGSEMFLYMENYDTPVDVYIDIPQEPVSSGTYIVNEKFTLLTGLSHYSKMAVSMVGVPAALNTTVQYITPFVKVLHNFALT
jgi:hypothetical protein